MQRLETCGVRSMSSHGCTICMHKPRVICLGILACSKAYVLTYIYPYMNKHMKEVRQAQQLPECRIIEVRPDSRSGRLITLMQLILAWLTAWAFSIAYYLGR